jgi:4-hydroxybenzoate polyprenyltransferase
MYTKLDDQRQAKFIIDYINNLDENIKNEQYNGKTWSTLCDEMIKDLENIKGDIANDYQTIPVIFGEAVSKKIITFLTVSTIIPVYFLVDIYEVGYMDIYFYVSLMVLILFLRLLWKSNDKLSYLKLHNILKFLVVSGVFCIVLIDPQVIINGRNLLKL